MKVSTFKVVVSVLLLAILGWAIVAVVRDIWALQVELDALNWVADNTHSGIAYHMARKVEGDLQRKFMQLAFFVGAAFLVVGTIWGTKILSLFKDKRTLQCFAGILLITTSLLTPTITTEAVTHYYARVEMNVSQSEQLTDVYGYVTPHAAGAVSLWVCHHIGVGFPLDPEDRKWIAGGYYHHETKGTVYYIEWFIDLAYHEITTSSGGIFDVPIWVAVDVLPNEAGWAAYIYDCYDHIILQKSVTGLPTSEVTRGVAGGESIDTENRMEASYSDLRWKVANHQTGYWGEIFPCAVIHDAPYDTTIEVPYYEDG